MLINPRLYPEVPSEIPSNDAPYGIIGTTYYEDRRRKSYKVRSELDYSTSYAVKDNRNRIDNIIDHRSYSNALRRRRGWRYRSHCNGNTITNSIT